LGIAFLALALLAGLAAVAGGGDSPSAAPGIAQVVCVASLVFAAVVFAETLFFARRGVGGGAPARPGRW
jgi:hypothetical protein